MSGTMTEARPGVWHLRVYVGRRENGSPIQKRHTFVSPDAAKGRAKPGAGRRLAEKELAKLVTKYSNGAPTGTETLGDLIERYIEHAEVAKDLSPTTLRGYRGLLERHIRPVIGAIKLSKLTAHDLDKLYASLTRQGLQSMSVRHVHNLISVSLNQGRKWQLVDRNVARTATPPPLRQRAVSAPGPDEVRKIVAAAEAIEPMMASLLLLAGLTGARRGELCALRWSDFDEDAAIVRIERSVYETEGGGWAEKSTKNHQRRRVSMDDFGMVVLRRHRRSVDRLAKELGIAVPPDAFMFSRSPAGSEPIRPDVVTKFMIRVAKKAGVSRTFTPCGTSWPPKRSPAATTL